ncbi:hypothetical conserved protein [Candidatus Nitrosoglobus terrae]|uniref:UPF0102 protein TAO_0215 n=1 Tax=Candidatus Nitrosoglobus terrae TaxID=1630141 RepID=A0A1Q2SKA4_9GAMM|nr:YraN family protein [Candidatus Nitrosoglobus terrae]BAW79585.1 hypothetical conserved protein [Candidatus Nitrosoglobus terrae]
MKRETSYNKGRQAEHLARDYLQTQGLRLTQCNYRCYFGEIDLIMEDSKNLIFVEVRYRRNGRFGHAIESITATKRSRLITTAQHYLQQAKVGQNKPCRFDVVGVTLEPAGTYNIIWLQDAFRAD